MRIYHSTSLLCKLLSNTRKKGDRRSVTEMIRSVTREGVEMDVVVECI
jgi:hypothetical protein